MIERLSVGLALLAAASPHLRTKLMLNLKYVLPVGQDEYEYGV
jgi:hypothetical protein